jgi:hypothetical protein
MEVTYGKPLTHGDPPSPAEGSVRYALNEGWFVRVSSRGASSGQSPLTRGNLAT